MSSMSVYLRFVLCLELMISVINCLPLSSRGVQPCNRLDPDFAHTCHEHGQIVTCCDNDERGVNIYQYFLEKPPKSYEQIEIIGNQVKSLPFSNFFGHHKFEAVTIESFVSDIHQHAFVGTTDTTTTLNVRMGLPPPKGKLDNLHAISHLRSLRKLQVAVAEPVTLKTDAFHSMAEQMDQLRQINFIVESSEVSSNQAMVTVKKEAFSNLPALTGVYFELDSNAKDNFLKFEDDALSLPANKSELYVLMDCGENGGCEVADGAFRNTDRHLLLVIRGPIDVEKRWAKTILDRADSQIFVIDSKCDCDTFNWIGDYSEKNQIFGNCDDDNKTSFWAKFEEMKNHCNV